MNNNPKLKVLLVEDDVNLGSILKEFLELRQFNTTLAQNGRDAVEIIDERKFDLYILDIMLPHKDGFAVAAEIRKNDQFTPVIFLTAKNMQEDIIKGFKTGCDDYITKPFSTEELFLRINAIMRRAQQEPKSNTNEDLFEVGKYTFDYSKSLLRINSEEKRLTSKEAELLKLLCINKNNVLKREDALKEIWNDDNYFTGRSMDVYIVKLRGHLKDDPSIEIRNIHGKGFKLLCN